MCINAHTKAGVGVKTTITNLSEGAVLIFFDNGDTIASYKYGAQMTALKRSEITNCTIRLFVDDELPDSALSACIRSLGLKNYMIGVGLCDKSQGGKR